MVLHVGTCKGERNDETRFLALSLSFLVQELTMGSKHLTEDHFRMVLDLAFCCVSGMSEMLCQSMYFRSTLQSFVENRV